MGMFDDLIPKGNTPTAPAPAAPQAGMFDDLIPKAGPRDAATVQGEYDAMPWYKQAGRAADDMVRRAANTASLGFADKLAGYLNGTGTEIERAKSTEAGMRAGSAGVVADLAGAVATPVGMARRGLSLPGMASAIPGVTGTAARTGLAAVEGAGYGGVGAKCNDQDVASGMMLGSAFGAGGNLLGEGAHALASKVAGVGAVKPTIPTPQEARASAEAAYKAADDAGVIYTPDAVSRLAGNVKNKMADFGYDPALQPGGAVALRRIEDLDGQNVTFKGLEQLRKVVNNGWIKDNPQNNKILGQVVGEIDDLVKNSQAGDVLTGDPTKAATAISEARNMWGRTAKAETIKDAVERGDLNATVSGTGWNTENALKQSLKSEYNSGSTRSFTPDEREMLRKSIDGTPDQNTLRWLGRLAPTGIVSAGGGIGGGAGAGFALGGPVGAAIGAVATPAAGFAARMGATKMQTNSINELLDVILAGGTKAAGLTQPTAAQKAVAGVKDDWLAGVFGADQVGALAAERNKRSKERR